MKIDIGRISLDIGNFRHKKANNEREAMQFILADEKTHKVSELAQDIVEMKGMDPSSLLIVTPDPDNEGHYIALEGNRRVTALKALATPNLAVGTPGHAIFKKLSPDFLKLGLTQLECVVLDRKAAFDWIKRKHYNAMGGRGVVGWSAIATARSDASEGKFTRWMSALNYLESHGTDTGKLLENIANKTTSAERVLLSPNMQTVLGLTFDRSGNITPNNGDHQAACTLLVAMLEKMGQKDFTEPKVTSADLQKTFIENFSSLSVLKNAPPLTSVPGGTSSKTTPTGAGVSTGTAPKPATGVTAVPVKPSAIPAPITRSKPAKDRKYLAEKGLRISNFTLNKLYDELKKLNVSTNPHVSAAMVRVFLEKATMVFLVDLGISCPNPNGWTAFEVKLRDKVKAALVNLDAAGTNQKLNYTREIANGVKDKLHTLDHLNRSIHDHRALPSPMEIVQIWDRYHPYFEAMFQELESNGK